jgi:hypothetical protein
MITMALLSFIGDLDYRCKVGVQSMAFLLRPVAVLYRN